MNKNLILLLCAIMLTLVWSTHTYAEETAEELAKKTQNPVANLISVPFQNNLNFGLGPHNRAQNVLLIQPVVPFNLTDEVNLITRTIAPTCDSPTSPEIVGIIPMAWATSISPCFCLRPSRAR